MKKLILIGLVAILGIGGFFLFTSSSSDSSQETSNLPSTVESTPDRAAEINGYVRSIEGNEVVIENQIKDRDETLTDEEKAAQQAERQAMSPEERQAARQATTETLETEMVTITIPVGVPILMSSGTADSTMINAELADIKSGTYLSIWLSGDEVEAVKLKGVN